MSRLAYSIQGLYQTPPQFAEGDASGIPYSYLAWVATHGIRLTGMPAFGKTLSQGQINDVTLYISQMTANSKTPEQVLLRAQLRPLYSVVHGTRACTFVPTRGARPHHFTANAQITPDGAFIIERFFNRGISEISALGYDARHRQYERTAISKGGNLDVSIADAPRDGQWLWRSIGGSTPGARLRLQPRSDAGYDFIYTDGGTGQCSAP